MTDPRISDNIKVCIWISNRMSKNDTQNGLQGKKWFQNLKKKNRNNIHTNDTVKKIKKVILSQIQLLMTLNYSRKFMFKNKTTWNLVLSESFNHLPITFNTFIYITVFNVYTSNKELSCSFVWLFSKSNLTSVSRLCVEIDISKQLKWHMTFISKYSLYVCFI